MGSFSPAITPGEDVFDAFVSRQLPCLCGPTRSQRAPVHILQLPTFTSFRGHGRDIIAVIRGVACFSGHDAGYAAKDWGGFERWSGEVVRTLGLSHHDTELDYW